MGDDNDSGNGSHYLREEEIDEFEKEFSGASSDTVKSISTLGSSASKEAAQQSSSGSSGRHPHKTTRELLLNKLTFKKMSRHGILWLLACNLLSYFVCTFKNVAEGYIHAKNANMGGAVQSL